MTQQMLAAPPAIDVRGQMKQHAAVQDAHPYASVPDPETGAEVDPHWLALRGDSLLPTVYLPPAMAGAHAAWLRIMAVVLVGVFVAATAAGICLTYGPPHRPF